MRYKVWTGPTIVNQVAAVFALVEDVTNVIAGTETVYFDSPHFPLGIERLAHQNGATRPCWIYLPALRRVLHLDAKGNGAECSKDLLCVHCTGEDERRADISAKVALADAKKKDELVLLALQLGIVKNKTEGKALLVAALRSLIAKEICDVEDALASFEQKKASELNVLASTTSIGSAGFVQRVRVRLSKAVRRAKLLRNRRKHRRALQRR